MHDLAVARAVADALAARAFLERRRGERSLSFTVCTCAAFECALDLRMGFEEHNELVEVAAVPSCKAKRRLDALIVADYRLWISAVFEERQGDSKVIRVDIKAKRVRDKKPRDRHCRRQTTVKSWHSHAVDVVNRCAAPNQHLDGIDAACSDGRQEWI